MPSAATVREWLTETPPVDSSGAWSLLSEPNQPQARSVPETVFALQGGDGRGFNTSARVDFALTLLSGRVPVQEQQCGTVVLTGVRRKLPSLWYEGRYRNTG